jgi:RNA polymerase sigma-70 factor (ECF subfamily)
LPFGVFKSRIRELPITGGLASAEAIPSENTVSPPSFKTTELLELLKRLRDGDRSAWDDLHQHVGAQLERLARKMLRDFPRLRRLEQTADVLQNATLRLLAALKKVQPGSVREFFGLAGLQLRRELLDLHRHYFGPGGIGRNQLTPPQGDSSSLGAHEPVDTAPDLKELEEWYEFHKQIEELPSELREVVDLHFYQGLPKADIAELLAVDVRTVQRRWNDALDKLYSVRNGQWPKL